VPELPIPPKWFAVALSVAAILGSVTGALWTAVARQTDPSTDQSPVVTITTPDPRATTSPRVPGTDSAVQTGSARPGGPSTSVSPSTPAPSRSTPTPAQTGTPTKAPAPSPEPSQEPSVAPTASPTADQPPATQPAEAIATTGPPAAG
jgi:hypothetical protein